MEKCWGGAVAQQNISQTILHNKSKRQDPAALPPKFSSQTDIGVEIVQSSVRVRINNTWVIVT